MTIAEGESVQLPSGFLKNDKEIKNVIFDTLTDAFNLSIKQFANFNYGNSSVVQKVINHPVHIIEYEEDLLPSSPSALIPFCAFGGNISIMGKRIKKFDVPVCNSFRAKILNDQLCYEVDPNNFKDLVSSDEFKQGITFYVDTNDDRQTKSKDTNFMIYLDTLGIFTHYTFTYSFYFHE